jgi:hypothetical protein
MIEFIDKTSEQSGTPINRKNMMAIQGFDGKTTTINKDGSITTTNSNGETLVTRLVGNGIMTETFVGEKTIVKTITFDAYGNFTEVIS